MAVRGIGTLGYWYSLQNYCTTMAYTGCEAADSYFYNHASLQHTGDYTDVDFNVAHVGPGFRSSFGMIFWTIATLVGNCSGNVSSSNSFFRTVQIGGWGSGCVMLGDTYLNNLGAGSPGGTSVTNPTGVTFGRSESGFQDLRETGVIVVHGAAVGIRNVTSTTAALAIRVYGIGSKIYLAGGTMTGIIEIANSFDTFMAIDYVDPVASLTTIRLSGCDVLWTDILLNSIRDEQNNTVWAIDDNAPNRKPLTLEVIRVYNNTGSSLATGQIVRMTGSTGGLPTVTKAQADTAAHATGGLLALVSSPADATAGYAVPLQLAPYMKCDANPTVGDMLYLSPTTAGNATSTAPAVSGTNQKRRLGFAATPDTTNTRVRIVGSPEFLPITADGGA